MGGLGRLGPGLHGRRRGFSCSAASTTSSSNGSSRPRATCGSARGFDPDTSSDRVVSADQLDRVKRYVGIGREEGAELVLGGERHGDVGFFHEPTIFTGVRNDMRIAQEEIFGPVMSVAPVRHRGGGDRHRQRHRVRARRGRVDERPRARAPREPRRSGRDRLGQHVPDGLPDRALRRREALGSRQHARRRVRSRR